MQKAAEATKGLIAQGAQLVWTSGDGIGNGVAAAAEQANIHTLGVTGSAGGLGAKSQHRQRRTRHVSDVQAYVDAVKDDSFGKKFFVSGLANHGLILTPVNEIDKRVPSDLQKQVEALVAQLASGAKTLPDFYGPAK